MLELLIVFAYFCHRITNCIMDMANENFLLIGSLLLFISILASKTSSRVGIPFLIFFVFIGVLAGSEGILGIPFTNYRLAEFIGVIALNFILFSGGLDTHWKSTRPILGQGIILSTLGVLITAGSVGAFVWAITDFTIYESLLLGSIVSSTDAAAVFSILRSKNLSLKYNLSHTLELESGSNDPMANVLTVAFIGLILNPGQSFGEVLIFFLRQMIIGAFLGLLIGRLSKYLINHIKLGLEGLYSVLVIAIMFFTYSFTDYCHGCGFLAVYITGVYLGNHDLIHKKTILKMFDGLSWLFQIVLFLVLGLLVFPSKLIEFAPIALLISLVLILVARPLCVFITLAPFKKIRAKSKIFLSWVGLRGGVPIVFATFPLLAGIEKAPIIFNIVFFISLSSVIIQGSLIDKVAKWVKVSSPEKESSRSKMDEFMEDEAKARLVEIEIPEDNHVVGKQIVDLKFPSNASIAMINRNKTFLTPKGSTVLEAGDTLVVLSDTYSGIRSVYELLELDFKETTTISS